MSTAQKSRADLARERAEEEKRRIERMAQKSGDQAGDVLAVNGATAATPATPPVQTAVPTPPPPMNPEPRVIRPSADTPITEKKKVDRQGIDLRPIDRERWMNFEEFTLRMKLGKKKGLTLYARAGLQLLEELVNSDPAKATELLKSL